jgi:hypothetical protein
MTKDSDISCSRDPEYGIKFARFTFGNEHMISEKNVEPDFGMQHRSMRGF